MEKALERFIKYVKIDTQSDENATTTPSAAKELDLSRELIKELADMGIKAETDEYGRVYAKLEGEKGLPAIGLNAHVDTALEVSGKGVKPQIIENYDGGVIKLNDQYSMSPKEFSSLKGHIGDTLVVTSGDTLLGADDKAGDAVIMAVLDHYVSHPEEKHHTICVLFTPDEEIGRGPEHFNRQRFGADFAYTIDGAEPDIIEAENFNASSAVIRITGVAIHPGEAKGKLVNALSLANEFDHLLSPTARPELTEGHEGFNHLLEENGTSEHCEMHYIIRNHDYKKWKEQEESFRQAQAALLKKYPKAQIELVIKESYRNMKEILDKDPRAIQHADSVYSALGIKVRHEPIRGGTDGATFSFLGCPTPNLGTGSYNHHGRFEYLSVRDFNLMIKVVTAIVKA